tara:strand:+ start:286 stop:417 length:132 start_codon:yes stop_codon:yes gene_type:complete
MDLNEILTKERDSLRDENIDLRKQIQELEMNLQKALELVDDNN